ncbi:MAG: LemA family protein [bacterium]|nr:MAG: LemA family protein [bacterium]
MAGWIVVGALVLLVLWGVTIFNRLVKQRNLVLEGWSGIDVQLKRRHDLIPNLVETVKGYMKHEAGVLSRVVELRNSAGQARSPAEASAIETDLTKMLRQLFALAEAYPDLKANQNFLDLQGKLTEVEEQIQLSRRYYNGTARDMNILVQAFPSNIVAGVFSFKEAEYFEIELESERETPEVSF